MSAAPRDAGRRLPAVVTGAGQRCARASTVEDVPLARTLFRACEIDDVIPTELYDAVARILAFIFSLRRRGALGDGVQRMDRSTLAEVG